MTKSIISIGLLLSLAACSSRDEEALATSQQQIIGGTVPAKGALEGWGVVNVGAGIGNCSGTLLTNRHVLTAQHCIRNIFGKPYQSYLPVPVMLEKSGQDQTVVASAAIEHGEPYSLEYLDHAILVLDEPMSVNGSPNEFYRSPYMGADSVLKSKSVFCAGYGMTTLATQAANGTWIPGGNFMLTSSTQTIDDVWGGGSNGTLIRRLHKGVVGAGGDSGSPCFYREALQWFVTGPQSNCPDLDWVDFNAPAGFDWSEATAVRECRSAAPSAFRASIQQNVITNVRVVYDALPALPAGSTAAGTITTTAAAHDVDLLRAQAVQAPRSGLVEVAVANEPANTMCPRLVAVAPMSGDLALAGRCLSDGLVASLL